MAIYEKIKLLNLRFKMLLYLTISILLVITTVLINTRLVSPLKKIEAAKPLPSSIEELEVFLRNEEEKFNPKPGTEKKQSKLSFVYLHGFSASRQEASPVFEKVASEWKAPLFMTRFYGHGLSSDDLGKATLKHWLEDALEAYQIGTLLGEEVVLTCMSTGCALGLYLPYFFPTKIKAPIFLSPNFAPADPRSFLALGPLGPIFTRLLLGPYREFQPENSTQSYYWTCRYQTAVLPEMISLVTAAKNLDLATIKTPVLTIYTPFDNVVSVSEIESNIPRLGSPINKLVRLNETKQHVVAGDIMNPTMNNGVIKEINDFLKTSVFNKP